ncbi:MAG: tRNA pseudouridine(38-40) synthase TruA [Dehalococcoidales bacterium]|nr:tRNA pseudouridine(38-40) synthase TruA [Dehalococcoidales bacterium]
MEISLTKIVLIMEYDGTDYYGFQLQANHPEQPTIQSELEKAVYKITGEALRVLGASRTDTGVHAEEQVVSFRTHSKLQPDTFVSGLNHYLPADIAVKSAHKVDDSFNVRSDAVSREYRYYILNRAVRPAVKRQYAYHVPQQLDTAAMDKASRQLVGEHDFAAFTGNVGNRIKTVRRVSRAEVKRDGDMVVYDMTAGSFLPHQIRNTVGALIQVGTGRMRIEDFYAMMEAEKPASAGPRVPPHGLFLMKVNYSRPFGEEN